MRILIASGFFESELPSYREYSYSSELAALGHDVTLMCGDQSQVWRFSKGGVSASDPTVADDEFRASSGVRLLRRHVFFRVSDLVLYLPLLGAIRRADVVHVIEFRQGITLIVALLARLMGKPVVYDHEQRGDRTAHWYSRVDSALRRLLIFTGSWCVSCVRHTVLANREHFLSCTPRKVETIFAPLGTDPKRFYFDSQERNATRTELGIDPGTRIAVMSGKLHAFKRIVEVVQACRDAGVRLILIGNLAPEVRTGIDALPPGNEIILPLGSAARLRAIYCAADIAVFTTFTLSYWEAYATGVQLVVPDTEFSEMVFEGDPNVARFGNSAMFRVVDEEYRKEATIREPVARALCSLGPQQRTSRTRYTAATQVKHLSDLYGRLTGNNREPAHAA
jgi:glycosyltransferase involved in cell wall biosynthesis